MGRPKRKRPPVVSHYDEKTAKRLDPNVQSWLASVGLQSLVRQKTEIHHESSPRHLQHVWAPIRDAEISSVADLSLQDIKVDDFGVAWLLRENSGEMYASKSHVPGKDVLGSHDITLAKMGTPSFSACDGTLQAELQRLRTQFSDVPSRIFKIIRSSCNPAEALGSGPFLNRSAMKLANIDAISDLADPVGARKRPLLFADICGGPGGFSEYLLRRRQHLALSARGWGISLRGWHTPTPVPDRSDDDGTQRFEHDARERAEGEAVRSEQVGRILDACSLDETGIKQHVDPCEWKLDQLSPWCDELFLENQREGQSIDSKGLSPRARTTPSRKGRQSSLENDVVEDTGYRSSGDTRRENGSGLVTSSACRQTKEFGRQEESGGGVVDSAAPSSLNRTPHLAAPPNAPSCQMTIDYGPDGTGDLTNLTNLRGFVEGVLSSTGGKRLDLVVADGSFLEARDTLEQDQVLSPLAYCETLTALLLLGEGGTFLCKLFEVWNEPTASLVYVLHRKFERVAILKPITSRPASSERYMLCKGLVGTTGPKCKLMDYLESRIHDLLGASGDNLDHKEVELGIPSQMKKDRAFMSYLRMMNDRLAKAQAKACADVLGVLASGSGCPWAFEGGEVKKPKEEPAGIEEADALAREMFYDAWRLHGVVESDRQEPLSFGGLPGPMRRSGR